MTQLWMHLLLSAVISTAVALLVATAAARIRFSASHGLRYTLDTLFALLLIVPFDLMGGTYRDVLCIEAVSMLPFLYICAILAFHNVNRETLDAARLQGMGLCGTFWRIFAPAGWKWLLGGAAVLLVRLILTAAVFCPAHCA